ncbi:hypothetical protein AG1IA_02929 [Rhizoctonia solani AG-1 IA]|uniref:Uncharacterized protein n=1 Tax=Thanatephorus cucumeris (strain AG1-IA) TaxID=983506 RepID=L8X1R6_THACA|nr:hypothetical protein AG1IA_02929 [Rhizoctonia solani AG-1 IA]
MTFDIGTIIDSDGKEVLPSGKMINAIVLTPERFEFELTPRSAKHEELIRENSQVIRTTVGVVQHWKTCMISFYGRLYTIPALAAIVSKEHTSLQCPTSKLKNSARQPHLIAQSGWDLDLSENTARSGYSESLRKSNHMVPVLNTEAAD